ncbi:MAG TPA: hypothetical protein VES69_01650 [Pyrinomonadaceae bacterium]|nr:hypothetical protein [Pyrinomonadaceae bacterium]
MFGISTSVFSEAGGLVKDWLKNPLNASFLYWYFLPAAGFVLLQLFFIGPALGHPAPRVFNVDAGSSKSAADLILQLLGGSLFALIILPLVIGVVLSALSGAILRFYQGTLPIMRPLVQPWLRRNQNRCSETYGQLQAKRREYLFLVAHGVRLDNKDSQEHAQFVPESDRAGLTEQLKSEIQGFHERFETISPVRELPVGVERVGPTNLANTLSVAEEYPFERYGMDTAVFWPRLCAEMEPEKLESLTTSFGAMNGLLNISLLSYVFAIECLIVGAGITFGWIQPATPPLLRLRWLFVVAPVGILVGLGAYRSAVRAAYSVGNELRTAFDYYRGRILRRFNLKMPDDIEQERVVWLKLAAFIRRGESFYYPSEFRSTETQ